MRERKSEMDDVDEKRKRVRYVLQACARTAVAVLALLVAAFHAVVLL